MKCPKCGSEDFEPYWIDEKEYGEPDGHRCSCGYDDMAWLPKVEKPMILVVEKSKPFPGCTCNDCPSAKDGSCEYAYDPYNTHEDCLAVK